MGISDRPIMKQFNHAFKLFCFFGTNGKSIARRIPTIESSFEQSQNRDIIVSSFWADYIGLQE
jgi:hypothetical protein